MGRIAVIRVLLPLMFVGLMAVPALAGKSKPYPKIPVTGADLNAFVPEGWEVISQAAGDLNGDSRSDMAAILAGPDLVLENRNCGPEGAKLTGMFDYDLELGGEEVDSVQMNPARPRVLIILLGGEKGAFRLALQDNRIVPRQNEGGMFDPIEDSAGENSLSIKRGSLFFSYAGGTAWRWHVSAQFRLESQIWRLIGFQHRLAHIHSKAEQNYDYNLLTGTIIITSRGESGQQPDCIACFQGDTCPPDKMCGSGSFLPDQITIKRMLSPRAPLALPDYRCAATGGTVIPFRKQPYG